MRLMLAFAFVCGCGAGVPPPAPSLCRIEVYDTPSLAVEACSGDWTETRVDIHADLNDGTPFVLDADISPRPVFIGADVDPNTFHLLFEGNEVWRGRVDSGSYGQVLYLSIKNADNVSFAAALTRQ